MSRRIKGDVGFRKLIRQLPAAAREGMADILELYGLRRLGQMKRDVPVATGLLRSRLSMRLSRKTLFLRVGFVGKAANGPVRASRQVTRVRNGRRSKVNDQFVGGQFYGRIIEFGRKAQTVSVHRRKKGVNSGLSRGRKVAGDIAARYQMRVSSLPPRPFVFKRDVKLRDDLRNDLRSYWNDVLVRASEGTSIDD